MKIIKTFTRHTESFFLGLGVEPVPEEHGGSRGGALWHISQSSASLTEWQPDRQNRCHFTGEGGGQEAGTAPTEARETIIVSRCSVKTAEKLWV